MARKITEKQRAFTLRVFEAKEDPGPIYLSIYGVKSMAVASAAASRMLTNVKIQGLLKELRQKAEDAAVMSMHEILERHSIIGRANLVDFLKNGQPVLSSDTPNHPAAEDYVVKYSESGLTKTIKLRDPVRSMQEICKLLGYYPKEGIGEGMQIGSLAIDNRSVNIGADKDVEAELISAVNRLVAGARKGIKKTD